MSTESPDLQLPQRPPQSSRRGRVGWLVYLLLLAVIALQVIMVTRPTPETQEVRSTDSNAERALAIKLEDRNLPEAAAAAWERYLTGSTLDASEEGAIRYRVGKLYQQADEFQAAVAEFYRAEQLLGDESGDLGRQITIRVRDCLRRLGQYSDLSREMAERSTDSADPAGLPGRQVVAQIGDEKLTVADFDRMLTEQIEQAIATQVGVSAAEADAFRRQAHGQLADPKARVQQLQQMVASRVLAEEARRNGLDDSEAFRRQLSDFADRLLASTMLLGEVERRATVTPQDAERFYEANKDRYAEPSAISIAHIVCGSEEQAGEVIGQVRSGADFGELAAQYSLDATTKDSGGVLEHPVSGGADFVPGVGSNSALHAAIEAAPVEAVLKKAYESDRGWHVIKVVGRRERVQRSFDEVRDAVERDVQSARRAEVTEQYIRELFEARGVKLYPNAFAVGRPAEGASDE